jgi:FKBP-type peptidyl-prolyl cis-trans isomerase
LINDKKEGIQDAIDALDEYGLTRDGELSTFKGKLGTEKWSNIDTTVKYAFTQSFNQTHKAINKGKLAKGTTEDEETEMLNDDERALVEDIDKLASEIAKKKKEVKLKSFDKKRQKAEEKKGKKKETTKKIKKETKDTESKTKKETKGTEPKKKLSLKRK